MKKNTTSTSEEKFKIAIEKVISKDYDESVGKTQLTKIVNNWKRDESSEVIKNAIEKVLRAITTPTGAHWEWIHQRYTYVPGYFWLENSSRKYGDTILGWHDPLQIQAEPLPLNLHYQRFEDERYCEVIDWGWEEKGFAAAEDIPLSSYNTNNALEVKIPSDKTWFFCDYGYAAPCQLQWSRKYEHSPTDKGLYVLRSIISHGFWCAWKWWPEAREWYYEHRPELFEEEEIWSRSELVQYNPPNSYSAVLSANSSQFIKSRVFYIDE